MLGMPGKSKNPTPRCASHRESQGRARAATKASGEPPTQRQGNASAGGSPPAPHGASKTKS